MNNQDVLGIRVIGVPLRDAMLLKHLGRLSQSRAQTYALIATDHAPDILLVDGDNPEAMQAWHTLCDREQHHAALPTIMLSKENTSRTAPLYTLQRPLVISRLFSVLEQISLVQRGAATLYYKALVVDDSPTTRKQVQIELEQLGIAAVLAASAEDALAILDQGEDYDLIFLDVVMPGANGYDVCKTIKRSKQRKQTPVIMLTGKGSPFDRVRGKLAGCNTYLTKPVGRERFQSTVTKYLPYCVAVS